MLAKLYQCRKWKFLLAVYSVALLCRVILVFTYGQIHSIENYEPLLIGKNIVEGYGFALHWPYVPFDEERWKTMLHTQAPSYGTTFIPPLVPYFYAGFITLFGMSPLAMQFLMVLQALIGALLPLFVYFATNVFFKQNAAKWAAIISVLYLPVAMTAITFSGAVFYPLAGLGIMYFLGKLWEERTLYACVGIGFFSGVLSLMRSEFYYMFFVLVVITVLIWFKNDKPSKKTRYISVIAIAFLCSTLWWGMRNYNEFGRFIPVTGHTWREIWRGYNPHSTGSGSGKDGFKIWENKKEYAHITKALDAIPFDNSFEEKADKVYKAEVLKFVKENPIGTLWLAVKKAMMFWTIDVYYEKAKHPLYIIPQITMFILSALGGYFIFKENRKKLLPWLLLFICYTCVFALTYVLPRYQSYVFPMFFPLCGVALYKVFEKKMKIES